MSYQIGEQNQIGKSDSTESINSSTKNFTFSHGEVEYVNVEERIQNVNFQKHMQIKNYMCYQSQNKFTKITEICWNHQCIRIKDFYVLRQNTMKQQQCCEWPKKILAKRFNYTGLNATQKKDTKNLIKNIVNLFIKWVKVSKKVGYKVLLESVKQIQKQIKYYNKFLIGELSTDRTICEQFIQFSSTEGENMVNNSRISDKQCHLKALKNYCKYFQESLQRQL